MTEPESPVAKELERADIAFRLVRHARTVDTSKLPNVRGVDLAHVLKNILLLSDHGPVLCILGCDSEIDPALVARPIGASVRIATPAEVLAITGHPVGDVPSNVKGVRKLVDESVASLGVVSMCAGLDCCGGINLEAKDLLRSLDGYELVSIRRPPERKPSPDEVSAFASRFRVNSEQARVFLTRPTLGVLFEKVATESNTKVAAVFLSTSVRAYLRKRKSALDEVPIDPATISKLVALISGGTASIQSVEPMLSDILEGRLSPEAPEFLETVRIHDVDIGDIIGRVLEREKESVDAYRSGDRKQLNFLIGRVAREAGMRLDMRSVAEQVENELNQRGGAAREQ